MAHNEASKVRIKDIAHALGLSVGTIDRALNNRPEISAKTRDRVLRAAKKMGYHPDLAASLLSSRRRLRIAVALPRGVTPFHEEVRIGIDEECATLGRSLIDLEYFHFPRLGSGEVAALDQAMRGQLDGIIISSAAGAETRERLLHLIQRDVPVVCVGTDLPEVETVASVTIDPFVSGALAGELVGRFCPNRAVVATVTGDLRVTNHKEKVDSFESTIRNVFPTLQLPPSVEAHDNVEEAYEKTLALTRTHPNLQACYVTTGNSIPVLKALGDCGLLGKVMIVTTDLIEDLIPHIRNNRVFGTLYQRPQSQGAIAYRALYNFLNHGQRSPAHIRLDPYLLMRSTLDAFLKRQRLSEL
jgi:LacI family transcriptional regulator